MVVIILKVVLVIRIQTETKTYTIQVYVPVGHTSVQPWPQHNCPVVNSAAQQRGQRKGLKRHQQPFCTPTSQLGLPCCEGTVSVTSRILAIHLALHFIHRIITEYSRCYRLCVTEIKR